MVIRWMGVSVIVSGLWALAVLTGETPIHELEKKASDFCLRSSPKTAPDPRIVLIAIDAKSIASLGRWPWSRDILARFLEALAGNHPRSVLLDIVFSEPQIVLADHALSVALGSGKCVLGNFFYFTKPHPYDVRRARKPAHSVKTVHIRPATAKSNALKALDAQNNLGLFEEKAAGQGHLNVLVDSDGVVRTLPLVIEYGEDFYPAMTLAGLSTALDEAIRVETISGRTRVYLGGRRIHSDPQALLRLRYNVHPASFPIYSFLDVLEGRVHPDLLRDKIILVGGTDLGTFDFKPVPVHPSLSGLQIQAIALNNLLRGEALKPEGPFRSLNAGLTFVLGLTAAAISLRLVQPAAYFVAGCGLVVLYCSGAYLLFVMGKAAPLFLFPVLSVLSNDFAVLWLRNREAEQINREQRKRLQQAEKMATVGRVISSIVHELKNPVSVISSQIELGLAKATGYAEISRLKKIEVQTQSLWKMIQEFLSFSRPQELQRTHGGLNKLICESIEDLRAGMPSRFQVVYDLDTTHERPVLMDAGRLDQVFKNLVHNAADAMKDGGVLTIQTRFSQKAVEIIFSDTGKGISRADLDKIFEPFFTTKPSGKGTGLGLAIVYEIIRAHDGFIEARSEPGKYTTFRITLPG